MKCWASILGDCSKGQSREHYLTKALYGGNVKARGLPWVKGGEEIELPINAMGANILCVRHNNQLSEVDAEAVRFKDFVADAIGSVPDGKVRQAVSYGAVDGKKLIRWLCKTVSNLETLYKRSPDPAYVRRAFAAAGGESVNVYMNTIEPDNPSHFRWWRWDAKLKKGTVTQVYIIRFGVLEWLVAPTQLTQNQCDAIDRMSQYRCPFKARPLMATRLVAIGPPLPDGSVKQTHQLTIKFPRRKRK